MTGTRVAIVHERFTELGGSEQVVRELSRIWPGSRVHTPLADPAVVAAAGLEARVQAGGLQRFYSGGRHYEAYLPLLPWSMARLDLSDADLVVLSHHAFANRVRVPQGVPVISYVHTPARWMWDRSGRVGERGGRIADAALGTFAATQRQADRRAAARPDALVANSHAVADRIRSWWGRSSEVVPPPVDTEYFTPDATVEREDFFLLAGRLVPYKRPELAVQAARDAGARLIVAGDGRHRAACERVAGPGTEFRGAVSREELRDLYRRCRALLFPGVEDFGIVPVEAQATGAPVYALAAGGALDTVLPGRSGRLIEPGSILEVTARFAAAMADRGLHLGFSTESIRDHAKSFSTERFHQRIRGVIDRTLEARPVPTQ